MTKEVIKLRAVHGLQQGPLSLTPTKDRITGKLKGVPEGQSKDAERYVDANTTRQISEGLVLNTKESSVDKIDWEWIRHNKEIAGSLEEALANPQALYYVDQPDREAEKRIDRETKSFKAASIIHEASEARRLEICRLLGQDAKYFRPLDLFDFLLSQAKNTPDRVIEAANDPDAKEKLFLYKCIDHGKIRKDVHGVFRFGDMVLGTSQRTVIEWMNDSKNRDIVARLYESLYGPATTSGSVIDGFDEDLKRTQENKTGVGIGGEPTDVVNK